MYKGGPRSASYGGTGAAGAGVVAGGARLDLCYVAERMLALHLPERDEHAEAQAAHMLSNKHGQHFMVFEVSGSEGGSRTRGALGRTRWLGWAGDLAPPLERLCTACKQIESWLGAHPKNVAVLVAWGSRERLGVLVAAYMHYSAICGAPEHALDRYAMRRYLDDRVPVFYLPSNRRYIDTFAGLLAGQIRVNAAPLHLTHVSVAGALASTTSPAVAFLKIYENLVCVYTSGLYMVSGGGWTVGVGRLALRGDVLVRAYRRPAHAHPSHPPTRQLVFACQFHTCAVADHTLSFTKQQLDHAAHDPAFPRDGAVELVFARGDGTGGAAPAPTPAAPLRAAPDALARHDSLEHLRPVSSITDDDAERKSSVNETEVTVLLVFFLYFSTFEGEGGGNPLWVVRAPGRMGLYSLRLSGQKAQGCQRREDETLPGYHDVITVIGDGVAPGRGKNS
ncbi:Tensin [Eumeta japonica]|uniref:Tensin n=1 Tax=Eumeta variegata TaxID=151549 RepID=A0A4C1W4J5_EUMVA|nr:Tensin [Eumeta japonica]